MSREVSDLSQRQLPLDLPHRPALGRDDFWVSESNAQAVALIDQWPDWPESAVLLTGPSGSGKTHLAEVWRMASGALRAQANDIKSLSVPELLSTGALVIEDVPGSEIDEPGFFHLLNLAREQKASLLITAENMPAHWGIGLPDLLSRLNALTPALLVEPDDMLLRAVLAKLFKDRQLAVSEAVYDYLLVRMERSLGAARDLVAVLDQKALAEHAAITPRFVARVLKNELS